MSPGQLRWDDTNPISNDLTIVSSSSKPLIYGHSTQHEFVSNGPSIVHASYWLFLTKKKNCISNNQLYINRHLNMVLTLIK